MRRSASRANKAGNPAGRSLLSLLRSLAEVIHPALVRFQGMSDPTAQMIYPPKLLVNIVEKCVEMAP